MPLSRWAGSLGPAGLAPSGPHRQWRGGPSCSGFAGVLQRASAPELPTCRPTLLNFWYFPLLKQKQKTLQWFWVLKNKNWSGSSNSSKVAFPVQVTLPLTQLSADSLLWSSFSHLKMGVRTFLWSPSYSVLPGVPYYIILMLNMFQE